MSIPNILTLIRFLLIPVFYITFFSGRDNALVLSIIVFFTAGITDVLDGYIARKYNMITKWGIVLDPLADKLMSIMVLYCLSRVNIIPTWVLIVFSIKEGFMIAGGVKLIRSHVVIPAKYYGKYATLLFYISIGIIIFNEIAGTYLIYASILMAVFAFIKYLSSFINILREQK
ncbi:CDP-alcohol phosphatidyltransferase family protein [Fonticella tunisiensis]|uniref:CDP-diacylglycerol--glycerol-3-phosphate 3-phosphatidyltransferase n=1 Tax=Fonticella tunisiensis TaxID=1096341 RepID=A0A4R7K9M8_9CLOT|nr:CDP-alcohol phosphatidyltransferase family protein [Fonticella tunisiensis]TDT50462.1 cardiolipin synthase [Fonticella tunisiensis]